ncbi:MAG: glycoside hydrolase family 3 C-terminal domain-containing protein [Tannerellaceae bacterium]|nr:glycoside hydrolase family 3 C-terminal domain-containing protein [Tannerellaceae bacterium]
MKKKFLFSFLATGMLLSVTAQTVRPAIPQDPEIENKIETLLTNMSLEDKIGQMTQLTIDVVGKGMNVFHTIIPFEFDEALLDTVIHKYKVGSILNVPGATPQTPQEWTDIITRLQKEAMAENGIPIVYGVDQMHGTTYTVGGTMFPQSINLGASFNRELSYESGRISAYETKAGNIPWTFAPVVDLGRDPRWPRMWETFGEDVYLVTELGVEMVKGFQGGDGKSIGRDCVAACMKHYMGYGVPFSGKDRTPSYISEQDMREKHFQPFLEAIRNGALSVMVNSGMNNGMPFHANYEYLTKWLKKDLNWDGLIVTDWADINNLAFRDKIAKDKKEAIKLAINAGIDMSMDPYSWDFCVLLKELVEEGEVPMERIDDATRRVLRMKYRLGLFERPYWNVSDYPDFASPQHAAVALKAAEESITLLKNNDQILPLAKNKKILITGPNANSMRPLNGGWSYSWQGDKTDQYAQAYHTILEAFTQKVGAGNIVYEAGVTYKEGGAYWEENEPEIGKAVAAAKDVDIIVACIGENSYCETPGNLVDLTLSKNQLALVKALAATGKPVVLVLNEGRPRIIDEIESLVQAVIQIYLPGNYGGDALANMVYGDVNPSGKLPYTYPKYAHSLITYDYKSAENLDKMEGAYDYDAVVSVQWAFGYGLSYTTFEYSNLKADKTSFTADEVLTFTVDVTNTGQVAGKESVLLFTNDKVATLTPDVRRLRAFDKIELAPGETKTVTLQVKGEDLAFVGYDGKWVLEAGEFGVQVGNQTTDIVCSATKKWSTPNR